VIVPASLNHARQLQTRQHQERVFCAVLGAATGQQGGGILALRDSA